LQASNTEASSAGSAEQAAASVMCPSWNASLADIVAKRPRVPQAEPRIGNALLFETDSLIDGRRTVLEIFQVVQAESWLGGSPYYGPVTLAQVAARMKALADAGLVEIAPVDGPRIT
jgi:hypothetical protein